MTARDTGGPTFPHANPAFDDNWDKRSQIDGMTLRDYFAIHASDEDVKAQAEVIREKMRKENCSGILPDGWRLTARYMHADAMLEARK